LNLLKIRVLGIIDELIEMLYGLIVMGNGLIGWILDDFVRNNDFEINWFNWCVGCENIEIVKNPC